MDVKTIEVAKLGLLIDIAGRAIELDFYEVQENAARIDLNTAYQSWKEARGIVRVERDSPDWQGMMADTAAAYAEHEDCKRRVRNARKRLKTTVNNYRRGGA